MKRAVLTFAATLARFDRRTRAQLYKYILYNCAAVWETTRRNNPAIRSETVSLSRCARAFHANTRRNHTLDTIANNSRLSVAQPDQSAFVSEIQPLRLAGRFGMTMTRRENRPCARSLFFLGEAQCMIARALFCYQTINYQPLFAREKSTPARAAPFFPASRTNRWSFQVTQENV